MAGSFQDLKIVQVFKELGYTEVAAIVCTSSGELRSLYIPWDFNGKVVERFGPSVN